MVLGMIDISRVTDRLVKLVQQAMDASALWALEGSVEPSGMKVTGDAPDIVREKSDPLLSIYLFHIAQDKYQRNSPIVGSGKRTLPIPFQPLSLDLYYLVSAHSKSGYVDEQRMMSIALKWFHENPIVKVSVMTGEGPQTEEFCLTMEMLESHEMNLLWQATSSPLRLATVYKVSVVFITPVTPEEGDASQVKEFHLTVDPKVIP